MEETTILEILNQLFEMRKKLKNHPLENSLERNIRRISAPLEALGYNCHDPLGEKYNSTRLDCEAMISGTQTEGLVIVEVVKPIIYFHSDQGNVIAQKGVVITEKPTK